MSVRKRKEGSHSGIAHIEAKIKYHNISASGFLVKVGEHFIVLTAASNLYDEEKGKAERVFVYFGRELDTYPHGVIVRKDVHLEVPIEHKEGHYGFDYGVISLVNKDDDFNKLPYFTLSELGVDVKRMPKIHMTGYSVSGKDVRHMTGYSVSGKDVRQMTMRLTKPKIVGACITYEDKTFPGNNGSPLYVEHNGMYVAVGIHIKTASEGNNFSSGILITSAVKARIEALVHNLNRTLHDETDLDDRTHLRNQKAFNKSSYQGPYTTQTTMGNKQYDSYGQLRESRRKYSSTQDIAEASRYQQSSRKQSDHYADVYGIDRRNVLQRWVRTGSEKDVSYSAGRGEMKELKQAHAVQSQQAEYKAFIPSQKVEPTSKAQIADCERLRFSRFSRTTREHRNILIPSNLPLSPMVRQLDDTYEELEKNLIQKDKFKVLPLFDPPDCPLRSKIFQTLKALSSSGWILMTSSLCELMHVSSHVDQPEEILLELFGVIPFIPTFVLCVIRENRKVEYLLDYTRDLTGNIQHAIRKFTNEKICSVHGTVMMSDFDSTETFREVLNDIERNSGKFCNSNSLFMNKGKCFNVSRACLVAMAASEKIPDTCRNAEIRLGSKEDLSTHLGTMNKSCTSQLQQRSITTQLITSQEDVSECDTRASWASEGHSGNYKKRRSNCSDWQAGRIARDVRQVVPQVAHQMLTSTVVEDTTLSSPGYGVLGKTPELQSKQLMPKNEQSLERISTSSDLPLSQTQKPTIQSDMRSELSYVPRDSETSPHKHVAELYKGWCITKDADGEEKTKARKSPSRYKERQAEKEESEKRNSLESIPTGMVQLLKRQFNA